MRTAILLLALLVGCARSPARDVRDDAFQQQLSVIGEQMDAGKLTRKQAAAAARDRAREIFNDPYMNELWSYRVVLADQVERGETTLEQAAYLDERKVNEIIERQTARPTTGPTLGDRMRQQRGVRCTPGVSGAFTCR